jgi:glycosyltransferase involved in cell wall biosynthesis
MNNLVSIIMPAYNAASYLPQAIESVLVQTYPHFELIVCNDGSKDNTHQIIEEYSKKDARIVLDDHENMGRPNTFNRGLGLAKGKYIANMDADDVMLPNRLEEQVKLLDENPDFHLVTCFCYYINAAGERIKGGNKHEGFRTIVDNESYRQNPQNLVVAAITAFTARKDTLKAINGFRSEMWPVDDLDLLTRIVEQGFNLIIQPTFLMEYRMHGGSIMGATKSLLNQDKSLWAKECMLYRKDGKAEPSFEQFKESFQKKSFLYRANIRRIQLSNFHYRNVIVYTGDGKYSQAMLSYFKSIVLRPSLIGRLINQFFKFALKKV